MPYNAFIRRYRDDLYKLTLVKDNTIRKDHDKAPPTDSERLQRNIRRASVMIEAYGLCNAWEWFCTFTLDKRKYDRSDRRTFQADFMRMIRTVNHKHKCHVKALLVFELHKDGCSWHAHALLAGIPCAELRPFTLQEKSGKHIRDKLLNGDLVYDWPRYREKFGFCDLEPIQNRDAAVRYIRKYITKELHGTAQHLNSGEHLYFVSRGLNLPEEMQRASVLYPDALFQYSRQLGKAGYEWDDGCACYLSPAQLNDIMKLLPKSSLEGDSASCETCTGGVPHADWNCVCSSTAG